MGYIAMFKNFKLKNRLKDLNIVNYTIGDDGTIDVDGFVNISDKGLLEIPFKFGRVTGSFNCSSNKLKSLKNCPYYVGEDFSCQNNRLVDLLGSPEEVGGNFICSSNYLETLNGIASEIGKNLFCANNPLSQLDITSNINGGIICLGTNVDPNNTGFMGYLGGQLIRYRNT